MPGPDVHYLCLEVSTRPRSCASCVIKANAASRKHVEDMKAPNLFVTKTSSRLRAKNVEGVGTKAPKDLFPLFVTSDVTV